MDKCCECSLAHLFDLNAPLSDPPWLRRGENPAHRASPPSGRGTGRGSQARQMRFRTLSIVEQLAK
ncbi:MAG: hypothetical protein ACFFA6_09440 [Promethearchaeota archaeon]